jgi:hypothetical protein
VQQWVATVLEHRVVQVGVVVDVVAIGRILVLVVAHVRASHRYTTRVGRIVDVV